MIGSACGSGGDQLAAEDADAVVSVDVDDLQYGVSIDDWESNPAPASEPSEATEPPAGYEPVTWEDLIPPGFSADEIFARYQDRLDALEDGDPEANTIYEEMEAEYDDTAMNGELDGRKIQMAGFVAPLTYEDDIVTEFLLVPYFGACIHVPAPPPNQTIIVTLDQSEGLTIEDTWGAVWVTGTLTLDSATTDLATAGYTITGAQTGVYNDF